MFSLLFFILFAAEPKTVDIDYKIQFSGLENLQGKVSLQEGGVVQITDKDRQYSFQADIVDEDELYIRVYLNKKNQKTKDPIFTEIITFDGVKAEVETFNKNGASTRLEIKANIL